MVVAIQLTAAILLVITALSAVVGADATKVNGPAARFVRFDTIADIDQNNEERGLNFGANPIIAKIKTRINKIVSHPKLHDWLKHRVSGDKVFEMLGLQLVQRNLLTNPNFLLWVKYVDDLNTKKPNPERVSAASLLTDRFGSAKISEMLNAAVKDQNTKAVALELQAQRLQDWKQLKKTPLDVFKLIHLSKSDTLLDPVFPFWLKYVDDFHSQNYKINTNVIEILSRGLGEKGMAQTLEKLKDPLQAGSAVSALTSHYGDARLSSILNIAMKDHSANTLAAILQTQRMTDWKHLGMSLLDVFHLLQPAKGKFPSDQVLRSWLKHMESGNEHPKKLFEKLFDGLGYGGLAHILEAGLNDKSTKAFSTQMKNHLFAKLDEQTLTPSEVFQVMGLKTIYEQPGPLLSDPVLSFWVRYVNEKYPGQKMTMLNTLRKNYVDEALVEMLVAAKKDPTTNTIATNLELLLLTRWLDEKKQPLSIAHWLRSDKSGQMMDHYSRLFKARLSNDNKP